MRNVYRILAGRDHTDDQGVDENIIVNLKELGRNRVV
jgi:hypothetical protein